MDSTVCAATLSRSGRRRLHAAQVRISAHPVLAVAVVAAVARVVVTIAVALRPDYTIPDETQYVGLARSVANGQGAEAWIPGYGQSLYDSTYTFSALLARLFVVFGAHQYIGQVIALVFGMATAALATWLACRVLPRPWALGAGFVVALLPSQVLWSSVVLRESMVWTCAAAAAVALALAVGEERWWPLVASALLMAASLLALAHLRQLVLLLVTWSALVAIWLFRPKRRVTVRVGMVGLALIGTIVGGVGPLGYALVEKQLPQLAVMRLNLSIGADTSIVHAPVIATSTKPSGPGAGATSSSSTAIATEPPASDAGRATSRSTSGRPATPRRPPATPPAAPQAVVKAADGKSYALDTDSTTFALKSLPSGLVAVTVRPFVWERSTSTPMKFAKVENLAWLLLYLLAAVGLWAGRHRRDVLAFPAVFAVATIVVAAVTQGNLGTAFRHRAEILWAVAIFAAAGARHLLTWYRESRTRD